MTKNELIDLKGVLMAAFKHATKARNQPAVRAYRAAFDQAAVDLLRLIREEKNKAKAQKLVEEGKKRG